MSTGAIVFDAALSKEVWDTSPDVRAAAEQACRIDPTIRANIASSVSKFDKAEGARLANLKGANPLQALRGVTSQTSAPATADPKTAYNQSSKLAGERFSTKSSGIAIAFQDGRTLEGKEFADTLEEAHKRLDKTGGSAGYLEKTFGVKRVGEGEFELTGGNPKGVGVIKTVTGEIKSESSILESSKMPWIAAAGAFLAGGPVLGIPLAITAFVAGKAVQGGASLIKGATGQTAVENGMTAMAGLGLGTAGGALAATSLGGVGSVATLGGMSAAAQLAGFDGLAFGLRKQMNAMLANTQDDSMISMINNKGIPIEDLIFYFLAYMSQKYEDKLREKANEIAIAEKMEREQQMRRDQAKMVGGLASLIPGVGTVIGAGIEMAAQKMNEVDAALNGGVKSSTVLATELQVLMNKWKQLTEMFSNIIKVFDDMKSNTIRNIR